MGLMNANAKFLADAKKSGVSFDRVLTIGNLRGYFSRAGMAEAIERAGAEGDVQPEEVVGEEWSTAFFKRVLGAVDVQTLDCSDYQGCDIVHDMNQSIAHELEGRFDVVVDGGSLEHIFNFPVALENCMRMVKPGGSLFIFTMANNHLGHGFYQFSPELFFRAFSRENGYRAKKVVLLEHDFPGAELSQHRCTGYEVVDPVLLRDRVGLVSRKPSVLMVHAVRESNTEPFSSYPIQSDYAAVHAESAAAGERRSEHASMLSLVKNMVGRNLPKVAKDIVVGNMQLRKYSVSNRRAFSEWD